LLAMYVASPSVCFFCSRCCDCLCILPKASAAAFCQELQEMDGWAAHIIGDVIEGTGVARIM
jgi:hypothetical protein